MKGWHSSDTYLLSNYHLPNMPRMPERPLADRPLLTGEYTVLGLLALGPRHGYDLARVLAADLGAVCPVEQSLLYAYLRNLEARGLVEWEEVRTGRRPPRKIYAPSEEGWVTFRAWVHLPVERMREVRQDLLLKIYFLRALDPAAERRLLERQVEVCQRYAAREAAALDALELNEDFPRLVAEARLSAANGTLAWLRTYLGAPRTPRATSGARPAGASTKSSTEPAHRAG